MIAGAIAEPLSLQAIDTMLTAMSYYNCSVSPVKTVEGNCGVTTASQGDSASFPLGSKGSVAVPRVRLGDGNRVEVLHNGEW